MNERTIAADGTFLHERIDRGHTGDAAAPEVDDDLDRVHEVDTVALYAALDRWPTDEPLPAWVEELSTACETLRGSSPPTPPGDRPFGDVVGRFVSWATAEVTTHETSLIEARAYDDLVDALWDRLTEVLAQPLHVDYCRFVDEEADVTARSTESTTLRESYATSFASGRYESFFEEFSLAGRFLIGTVHRWQRSVERLLTRLHDDRDAVCELADADDPFPVVGFSPDAGDRHGDGETVVVVGFADEKVVYKPRSVAPSRSLSRVFDRLTDVSSLSVDPTPTVVVRDGYGWVEYVERGPFDSRRQLATYYDRAGVVAWLSTVLGSTDLHYENLVATTDGPTIVDAETAIGTLTRRTEHPSADGEVKSWVLGQSVFETGLVPFGTAATRPDLSGLGATQPERMSRLQLQWTNPETDAIDIQYERRESSPEHNHPRLRGDSAPPWLFVDELTTGFRRAQTAVRDHAETIRDAATTAFAGTRLRAVVRNSRSYGVLLDTLSNPQYLRDVVAHERKAVETLWSDWSNTRLADREDARPAVVAAERDQLLDRAIPRFTVPSDGRSLRIGEETVVEDALDQTPLASLERRIELLCDWELERQQRLLSLAVSDTTVPPTDSDRARREL